MEISEQVKKSLKKPLGELQADFREIKRLSTGHRIISIGDICTLGILAMGIRPHLAVFDYRYMRNDLDPGLISILKFHFKNPKKYQNKAGTLSDEIIRDAKGLIEEGGAVLIEGEEDLTALAFIKSAGEKDIIIYGQPEKGIVIVVPGKEIKKKIDELLSLSF